MRKYNLARMLEDIRRDQGGAAAAPSKKVLTQQEIKALASARRAANARKPAPR
jgi:hypothetical protein